MKKFGIRQIVTTLTLLPLLVIVASMEFFFLHMRFSDIDNGLLQRGQLIANQLASASEYGVFSNNQAFLQNIALGALQQDGVRSVVIQNANSETLVQLKSKKLNQTDLNEHPNLNLSTPIKLTNKSLWVYQPIVPIQIDLGEHDISPVVANVGAIIIEMGREGTEHLKSQILWFTMLITMVILVFPMYAIYRTSRGITRPIGKLNDAVFQISQGNLEARVFVDSNVNEISSLSFGINVMAEKLQHEQELLQGRVEEVTQALRLRKEEAEHANQDKSRFLAVASHDLRQPLHALGLYVTELRRKVSNFEQQHLVGQIEHSIEALSALLNALLDISKLDAGAVVPHLQICDVNALLDRISSDYQMLASLKNIRLIVRPCDAYVISDPLLLERVVSNLVSNAIRYTNQNGCVLVACRHRNRILRFEVRDNGIGISKEHQRDIFREFFQLSQSHFEVQKGLGLGLAIVDRLTNLLGHRMELRSAPGKGSVFAVEAEISAPPSEASNKGNMIKTNQNISNNPLTGKRVLVVDDDNMVLSSTASVLTAWGCIVDTADSLTMVNELLLLGESWDLLISDYQLSNDTTGFDVVAMICQHQKISVPCIFISGDTGATILKLVNISGHHLLHKPVRPAKLRSLVTHLLQGGA